MFGLKQAAATRLAKSASAKPGLIGLEFAFEFLHMVQLAAAKDGTLRIKAQISLAYSDSREATLESIGKTKALIQQGLRQGGFDGRQAVSVLPTGNVRILSVGYQCNQKDDGAAIMRILADRIDGNLAEYVVDFLPVRGGKGDEERLAIVALAKRRDVIDYIELLRKSGLQSEALEIGPAAIRRLITSLTGPDHFEPVLVINFGCKRSFLTMISGRRLLFDQETEFGEDSILRQISRQLEMSLDMVRRLVMDNGIRPNAAAAEWPISQQKLEISQTLLEIIKPSFLELADEINRVLIYAASETRGGAVSRVYLLGGIAHWPGADALLNGLLDIPVSAILDPLQPFRDQRETADSILKAPGMAIATGLALRGMVPNE